MQIGSGSVTSLISREAAGRILFDPGITFARALLHSSVTNVGKLRSAVDWQPPMQIAPGACGTLGYNSYGAEGVGVLVISRCGKLWL